MHIVIPMSGIGKRFIDQGYVDPKPLIEIDGKPIIEHVVNLFPGESKFTFICNRDHLETTKMREILTGLKPDCNIVDIDPHKKGPVYAVSQIYNLIDDEEEVIVNYCDFGTYWDYKDFLNHTRSRQADGAIPSYKGFHPHMLGSTNYAFMRDDKQWMLEIKEKAPFTDNRMEEYASNGTYYFRKGEFVKKYFTQLIDEDVNLKGEYYVSLIYNLLVSDNLKVSIYEIQHMLQWGTPADVEEYLRWSDYFKSLLKEQADPPALSKSVNLIPLAGKGSRFQQLGYTIPKPLIDVSGKPMVVQAAETLPPSEENVFICLEEHLNTSNLGRELSKAFPKCTTVSLDHVTEGQAITCDYGLKGIDGEAPILIAACDNGMVYDKKQLNILLSDQSVDAVAWTFKNHPSAINNPEMYGWVKTVGDTASGVSVKEAISDTPQNDHAIVGTFFFRKKAYFSKALDYMISKDIRVNNEYYVDSMVGILVDLGLNVKVFEVDSYICWGTPNDYETFCYWQSFFHKSDCHPYSVSMDHTFNQDCAVDRAKSFSDFKQENH